MEAKADGFFQTALWEIGGAATSRTEKMDVVIGSGRRGQTYLYWKKDQLFQLPVSYWTSLHLWINSPNYIDGEANFEKRVLPNCLACHMSYAAAIGSPVYSNEFKKDSLVFGISCERCHGPGKKHAELMAAKKPDANMVSIGKLSRERQVEVCAQCHGGLRPPLEDPFSYAPGEPLEKYFRSTGTPVAKTADVHGNQVGLLQMSKCYQSSASMTCSTCHNVHQTQRDAPAFSQKCLSCHKVESCGEFAKLGQKLAGNCVDCHMPVQASNAIVSSLQGKATREMVRSHWIKVYSGAQPEAVGASQPKP
jgi:cytochrome c554/c'-like protein